MLTARLLRLAGAALLLLVLMAGAGAVATSNEVATSGADVIVQPAMINGTLPPECAGLSIVRTVTITAGGTWTISDSGVLVIGTGGKDTIYSYGMGNCVVGGGGSDLLFSDRLDPGTPAGGSVLIGGAGNDTLTSGPDSDWLYGGDRNDTLYGGGGDDWLYGEEGNDTLYGEEGNDTCDGGPGNDTFYQCEAVTQ